MYKKKRFQMRICVVLSLLCAVAVDCDNHQSHCDEARCRVSLTVDYIARICQGRRFPMADVFLTALPPSTIFFVFTLRQNLKK
mmetsp:Transcript_5446/g.20347  ORF Transcript_5446/g.20347 Transcript_5446/m.20347 type:complete len:83 (-) Transcript_5446:1282-1530(-)